MPLDSASAAVAVAGPAPKVLAAAIATTRALEPLERELIRLGIITERANAGQYARADTTLTGTGPNGNGETKSLDQIRTEWRDHMVQLLTPTTGIYPEATEPDMKALPPKPPGPIEVVTFEC
jgi:hypothetical protein